MKKIRKRFGSVLLALCLMLTLMPTVAFAADASSLKSTIESYTGGNGSLYADVSADGSTVTVTGTVTDASSTLTLNIDSGVTVIWRASITATADFTKFLLALNGEGTLEVAESGTVLSTKSTAIISNSTGGVTVSGGTVSSGNFAIYNSSTGRVTVSGGTVENTGNGSAIYNISTGVITVSGNATVKNESSTRYTIQQENGGTDTADRIIIEGGTVENTGTAVAINNPSSGGVRVSGGTVSAAGGCAIYNSSTGRVTVSGGTVENTGTGIAIYNSSTGEVTVSGGTVSASSNSAINNSSTGVIRVSGEATVQTGAEATIKQNNSGTDTAARIVIEGGTVKNTGAGCAISNASVGEITISGGNVSASTGSAIYNSTGIVRVSGTATVQNSGFGSSNPTILQAGSAEGTADRIIVEGGTVENSGTGICYAIYNTSPGGIKVSGGLVSSYSYAINNGFTGGVTVSGGTVESVEGAAIGTNSTGAVTVSGGIVSATTKEAIVSNDITVSGGVVFAYGTDIIGDNQVIYQLSPVTTFTGPTETGVVIAWNQGAGTTTYDGGDSTDLIVLPDGASATWDKSGDQSGISYTNGSNTGFFAVDGVTVEKTSVTVEKLSFTDLSTLQLMYNGTPQGIGNVTAAAGLTLGAITVYYTGINGTTYVKSTTAPTNTGTYQVTADVAGNVNYDAVSNLVLGEYTILKATAAGVNQNYAVLVNSAQEYTFDLTTLLPDGVDATQVSAYAYVSSTNDKGIFSGTPSVSGTTLTLPVNSVATAGFSDTVTINFTSDNYNISGAVVTVETVNKTPVTITAAMPGGVYNGQTYAYNNAAVTANSDNSDITDSVTLGVSYEGINGTTYGPSADAPKDAGRYQLTLSVPDSDATYTGSAVYTFTITKRPVTVKADNKSVTVGSDPVFTYTVDGLLSGETALIGEPYLAFAEVNTTKAGSYTIDVFLTGVSYTDNYKAADPAYVNGTLTVSNASSGGNTPSGGGSSTPATPAPTVSGSTATTTVTAQTGTNGKATASVTQSQMSTAITAAQKAATSIGEAPRVEIQVSGASDASAVETTLSKAAVQALVTGKMDTLTLSSSVADIAFDAKAIATIASAASGDVKFSASKVESSTLSDTAAQIAGNRPVYKFSITSGSNTISQFGGAVTVSVPYTPAAGENVNAIVAYYINANGEPELMQNCHYDTQTGTLVFTTTHFSTYAVGYNKVAFSDVTKDAWCYDAVTFLAARGITGGTTETTFSPNATLPRGQFITLVLRAYGIEPDENPTDNFADAGDTYYTGYLAAAKRLSISNGVGENKFAPEQAITRQEMFTLLYNALKAIDQLPEKDSSKALSDFTDSANISSYAQEGMAYLVKAGIVGGSNGHLSPTATTTRAEMAQVLHNLLSK